MYLYVCVHVHTHTLPYTVKFHLKQSYKIMYIAILLLTQDLYVKNISFMVQLSHDGKADTNPFSYLETSLNGYC